MLNFVGTFDVVCNHLHQDSWANALHWSGQDSWKEAETMDWEVDGEVAGSSQSNGKLTVNSNKVTRYCCVTMLNTSLPSRNLE